MKNFFIGVFLIGTLCFGGLYFYQTQKTSLAKAETAALEQRISELEKGLAKQEKQAANLSDSLESTRDLTAAKMAEAAQLREALTSSAQTNAQMQAAAKTNSKPGNFLSEMFKDPKMKELIKTQQKAVFTKMVDKNYKEFFAAMQLTPEQTVALKDLITKKLAASGEIGMAVISEEDSEKRAAMVKQSRTETQAIDAEIKQFLGDDNYAQFQTYEKTQGQRTTVASFNESLGGGQNALSPAQEKDLVQAMTEESDSFKFTTDFKDQSKLTGDFASYFSEDKMNQFVQELDQLSQRYEIRARSILSADQLTAYQKFLTDQREMQAVGMQMAAKMFAPKKENN